SGRPCPPVLPFQMLTTFEADT
ncbi:hypothetical protein CCACVL1_15018, partial [Corchorus capsularis]